MKRTALSFGVALTVLISPVTVKAHGGCFGFWPLWPLAFGTGIALGAAAYHDNFCYPRYVYAPAPYSRYGYSAPAPQYVAVPAAQGPALSSMPAPPPPAPVPEWVPSSPGAGHWVPDPHPYAYVAKKAAQHPAAAAIPPATTVTVTSSPGNVPVYTISR